MCRLYKFVLCIAYSIQDTKTHNWELYIPPFADILTSDAFGGQPFQLHDCIET